jgi:excisionase family DNA binding protein
MMTYTTGELARFLGLQRHRVQYLLEAGHIPEPTHRAGGRRLFTTDEADAAQRIVNERRLTNESRK